MSAYWSSARQWLSQRRTIVRLMPGRLIVGLAVGVGVAGAAMAYTWPNNDPTREIGGALVSGAVIGLLILGYEEVAERRREQRADDREDRYESKAQDRAAAQLIAQDRLAVWQEIDRVLLMEIPQLLSEAQHPSFGPWDDDQPFPPDVLDAANAQIERIRVKSVTVLSPLSKRLEDQDLQERISNLVKSAQTRKTVVSRGQVVPITKGEYTNRVARLTEEYDSLTVFTGERRAAERHALGSA